LVLLALGILVDFIEADRLILNLLEVTVDVMVTAEAIADLWSKCQRGDMVGAYG
jgi:hypothetical protein